MRTQESNVEVAVQTVTGSSAVSTAESGSAAALNSRHSYHELADIPVAEMDVIDSLRQNLARLQDLQGRMSFIMREVRYLLKV